MRLKKFILVVVALMLLATGCAGDDAAAPTPSSTASTSTTTQPTTTGATSTTTTVAPTRTVEDRAVDQPGMDVYRRIVEELLPAGAATEWDLVYATWEEGSLTLDMYAPAEPAGAPIVIYLPGGGQSNPWPWMVEGLVEEGAFVFVVGYAGTRKPERALADHGAGAGANAESVACAIYYARAQASKFANHDPVVVLTGHSHGGALGAHVALFGATLEASWDEYATKGGPPRQVECEVTNGSTHVDALVGMNGTYDVFVPIIDGGYGRAYQQALDPELWEFLSSSIGANPDLKVRLIHATSDYIPVEVMAEFTATLSEAGNDVQFTTFDGLHHESPPPELFLPTIVEVLGR
jgi:acetyl esterase/lipase